MSTRCGPVPNTAVSGLGVPVGAMLVADRGPPVLSSTRPLYQPVTCGDGLATAGVGHGANYPD